MTELGTPVVNLRDLVERPAPSLLSAALAEDIGSLRSMLAGATPDAVCEAMLAACRVKQRGAADYLRQVLDTRSAWGEVDADKAVSKALSHKAPPVWSDEGLLHEFACRCAERALNREREAGREPDPRSWAAVEAKRRWLKGEIGDEDLGDARRNASSSWSAAAASAAYASAAYAYAASAYAAYAAAAIAARAAIAAAYAAAESAWSAAESVAESTTRSDWSGERLRQLRELVAMSLEDRDWPMPTAEQRAQAPGTPDPSAKEQ